MTMLQIHNEAIDSHNVPYHEFLLVYNSNARVVYGFVEGKEDPIFYRGLIENIIQDNWSIEFIKSGNKDKVIKAMNVFDWGRFSPKRICFFIDRDLSDFIKDARPESENLYVTDGYSIENYAVNFGTMRRILEEVLNISGLKNEEIEVLDSMFESNLCLFVDSILPIMAQIILWRRNGEKPCLDNINIKEFYFFSDGKLHIKDEYLSSESRVRYAASCVNINLYDTDSLIEAETEVRQHNDLYKFVRGKYLLWFFVKCALEFHQSISKLCIKYKSNKPRAKISLGYENSIVTIAPRVRCPVSLQAFIRRNYCEYIFHV